MLEIVEDKVQDLHLRNVVMRKILLLHVVINDTFGSQLVQLLPIEDPARMRIK